MGIKKLKLAVFISGRGSNMQTLAEACQDAGFPGEIVVVLSNRPDAAGLAYAQSAGIPTECVDHKLYGSREDFEREIQKRLAQYSIDYIILAGFMRVLTAGFVNLWPGKIINIHPSLLPDYKGTNTHARVLEDGRSETGCTVHFVVPELDSGKTIIQKRVPVLPGDTPEILASRVLEQEHVAYPEAIRHLAAIGKSA